MSEKLDKPEKIQNRESWLKTGVIIFFSLVIGIPLFLKLISNELQIDFSNINFESLLTLIVSFFAIGLSVMFYFKATDSSNEFYNNSYTFTKDIAETLRGIEAGFGEKLTSIGRGYDDFRKSFENSITPKEKATIQKEVEKETKRVEIIGNEKESIIDDLIKKSKLSNEEINNYITLITKKEFELNEKNNQINELKEQLINDEINSKLDEQKYNSIRGYTRQVILPNIPKKILNSKIMLSTYFKRNCETINPKYLNDMFKVGLIDDENILTNKGMEFLKQLNE